MAALTDQDITSQAGRGDRSAQTTLIRRHMGQVWALARYHVGEPVLAAKITRRALVKALAGISRMPDPRKFRSWLHETALEIIRDTRSGSGTAGDASTGPARDEALVKVQSLPENLRGPTVLRYFQGASYANISSRLGVSRERVDQLIQRAKQLVGKGA
ncbi:MAG: sigma-70 family RNA polymerase sigma factor [Planctomycetota bacterium]|nr:sigma-70 family RNA polymerase sigma factor [Planctomycetota bacterium]